MKKTHARSTPSGALEAPLDDILGAAANIRILRALAYHDTPLGRAEAGRRAGITSQGARKAIDRLFDVGILQYVGSGNRQQVRLREEHPLASVLVTVFQAEAARHSDLKRSLKSAVQELGHSVQAAWIEGPVAEGADEYGDPLILGVLAKANWVDELAERIRDIVADVERKYDVTIDVRPYTEADLTALSFQKAATVPIFGPDPIAFMQGLEIKASGRFQQHYHHDERALHRARRLADLLVKEPNLRERALDWLAERLQEDENKELREWQRILQTTSPARLRRLLTADTDRAVRLRQSLPFWSVLTDEERQEMLAGINDEP